MALFAFKYSLRNKLGLSFNKYVVISERHLRGRIRSDFKSEIRSDLNEELDDHELSTTKVDHLNQFDRRDSPKRQELYDSRNNSSFDMFERARHGFNERDNYYNKNNKYYDKRQNFDPNYRKDRRNEFNDNYNDNKFNKFRRDDNFMTNNYKNFNRNEYMSERSDSGRKYDNNRQNRYYDRKQSQEFQSHKYRNRINDFDRKDNDIYNVDKQFDFDDQNRPRFSRFRQNEINENKKFKRIQNKTNENNIDLDKIVSNDNIEEQEEDNEGIDLKNKKEKTALPFNVTLENRFEVLNQMVTPLHLKPYDIQLGIKYGKQMETLRKLAKKLKLINSPVVCDPKGLPCPLELVKPSPITERYRNKDEFSIWPGVDGYNKTLGFFIGQPSLHHNVVCVEPDQIIVSRESHLSIAKKFQNYLKEISPYDSCQNYGEGGHWRRFHIRSNIDGNHMISAHMHPQQLTQQELDEEMQRLRQYFEGDQRISSLYFQASRHTRLSNEREPYVHLLGDKTITETLFDKKFVISVDSFFQINTSAAEVLYRNVMSELNLSRNTTVLDICCGTGTLATLMAPNVCRVIGIDSSVSAINDANRNAALNSVKNTTFIAGSIEDKLPQIIDEFYSQDIVVVANPTRGGLHSSVINSLREINFIRKLVYVSCKPEGTAFKNFIHLCLPANKQNRHLGSPFVPTNAIPVDMFPHTNHCELILTFERF